MDGKELHAPAAGLLVVDTLGPAPASAAAADRADVARAAAGDNPNRIDVATLNDIDRRILQESFRVGQRLQLPDAAQARERVDQHLRIGMRAVELLRQERPGSLHSRKLRSFAEVAFQ